ncbi:hypothetical protein ACFQU2_16325 [Siccirubricoccus deserti]
MTGRGLSEGEQSPSLVFSSPEERAVAGVALDVIGRMERKLGGVADLAKPEVQAEIAAQVREMARPAQGALPVVGRPARMWPKSSPR